MTEVIGATGYGYQQISYNAAGASTITIRPAVGKEYLILYAACNGAGANEISLQDGTSGAILVGAVGNISIARPVVVTRDIYLVCSAGGGGATGVLAAGIVLK